MEVKSEQSKTKSGEKLVFIGEKWKVGDGIVWMLGEAGFLLLCGPWLWHFAAAGC
jgi:hypothetical protein